MFNKLMQQYKDDNYIFDKEVYSKYKNELDTIANIILTPTLSK